MFSGQGAVTGRAGNKGREQGEQGGKGIEASSKRTGNELREGEVCEDSLTGAAFCCVLGLIWDGLSLSEMEVMVRRKRMKNWRLFQREVERAHLSLVFGSSPLWAILHPLGDFKWGPSAIGRLSHALHTRTATPTSTHARLAARQVRAWR